MENQSYEFYRKDFRLMLNGLDELRKNMKYDGFTIDDEEYNELVGLQDKLIRLFELHLY